MVGGGDETLQGVTRLIEHLSRMSVSSTRSAKGWRSVEGQMMKRRKVSSNMKGFFPLTPKALTPLDNPHSTRWEIHYTQSRLAAERESLNGHWPSVEGNDVHVHPESFILRSPLLLHNRRISPNVLSLQYTLLCADIIEFGYIAYLFFQSMPLYLRLFYCS